MSGSFSGNYINALAHPTIVDPAKAIEEGSRAAQTIWANREAQAQSAWGNALAASTETDGTVDYNKARALAAQNPAAQMGMMAGLKGSALLSGAQQEQGATTNTLIGNAIETALKLPDNQLHAGVEAGLRRLIDAGAIPRQNGLKIALQLSNDPATLRTQLDQHRISLLPPQMRQEQEIGSRPTITAGGATYQPYVPPLAPGQPGPTIVHSASPESGQDLVERPTPLDAAGKPIPLDPATGAPTVPAVSWRIDRVPRSSLPGSMAAGTPGTGPQPPTPPTPGTKIPGGYVAPGGATPVPAQGAPAASPPNAPATPAPAPAVAPAPATPTPAVVGTPLTTGAGLEAAAQHAAAARDKANNYQQTIQPIEGALTALASADTGKASELLNNLRGVIQDVTPGFLQRMLPASITDPERRKSFDEANKYLTQMQLAAPGGARSDVGAATAGAASPSVHISPAAAIEVGRAILAQRRMEQIGTMLFNQTGQPPGAYDQFMNKWATSVDPRAFVADKLNATERARVIKDMGGTGSPAYQQYRQSYQDAVTAGVIRHGG